MCTTITVRKCESVPADATVRDFDELPNSIKSGIADAVASDRPSVSVLDDDQKSIQSIDVVRFTAYYRIQRHEAVLDE